MPTVPAVAPTVAPQATSGLPYQSGAAATPEAFGAGVGQAQQRLGAGLDQLGDVLEKHALKMQDEVNASSAKDLFLAADVEVGKLTVDYNALEGANRVNAYPKFVEDIGAVREKMKQQAPNGAVAKLFDQDFARRVGYSIVDGARSAASANKQYQRETNAAVRENSLSHIAANAQDDNRFATELSIGKETFQNSDEYKGSSPEVKAQHDQAFVTSAWSTRLQAMARTEPLRARELFDKNKDALDGLTQIKLKETIDQQINNVQSRVDSDTIVKSGALVSDDLAARIKKFEGYSDKPYKDFKQTSSGYGTKAQTGDEVLSPAARKQVFEERLQSELGRAANLVDTFAPGLPNGTRDALISLTYNAGADWMTAGLGQKIRAGDFEGARANFVEYNRAGGEVNPTLVGRRAEEASWFGGEPVSASNRLSSMLDKARERSITLFPDDPANQAKYMDTLQGRIRADTAVLHQAATAMQQDNRNTVQAELFNPDHSVTSYDKLSPKAQQAFDLMTPEQQKTVRDVMVKNATADVPYTAERRSRGDVLYGMSRNEPDKFMATDIAAEDLTRVQKSDLLKMQADRKALLAKGEKLSSAMAVMGPTLQAAGITRSGTIEEFNKYSGAFEKVLNREEEIKKRPLTDIEKQQLGNGLLRETILSPSRSILGVSVPWASKGPGYTIPQVKTAAEAAALAPGAKFMTPDGRILENTR